MRTPGFQLADFRGNGIQSADTGAKVHSHPLRGHRSDHTAFPDSLNCRAHGVLGVPVAAQSLASIHVSHRVKVHSLGAQLRFELCGIKIGDGADAVEAGNQIPPGCIHIAAQGADDAQTGYDHASEFMHNVSPYMAVPPSTRRTTPVT